MTHKYIIKGDPMPLSKNKNAHSKFWDNMKSHMRYCIITLEGQHDDKPLYATPITIELNFYVIPHRLLFAIKRRNNFDTIDLVKFIQEVATNTIYARGCPILSITANKKFDLYPRTEIIINTLEKDEEEKQRKDAWKNYKKEWKEVKQYRNETAYKR